MNAAEKIKVIQNLISDLSKITQHDIIEREIAKLTPLLTLPAVKQCVYTFSATEQPILMNELALIRETCWKAYGCGGPQAIDIDYYDTAPNSCYRQFIVWDETKHQIIGGCRYISLIELQKKLGTIPVHPEIRTCEMFHISKEFETDYLPGLLEIQRLFVIPQKEYASASFTSKHASNVVDSLFKGIGMIISKENITCLTGRVLFSPLLLSEAENKQIMDFLHENFAAYHLMLPKVAFRNGASAYLSDKYTTKPFPKMKKVSEIPRKVINKLPTLLKIYMTLTKQFYFFGAVAELEMANSLEIAIMLVVKDLKKTVVNRYLRALH